MDFLDGKEVGVNNISVVIPLYNKEYFVERCLNSIESQTSHPFEVLIVNDGSTDNSMSLVNDYCVNSDLNIKIINQDNLGVSVARNNGVKNAVCPHVAFLDADDEWMPEFIERSLNLINKYPDAVLYTFKHQVCDDIVGQFVPKQYFGPTSTGYIVDYLKLSIRYPLVNSSKVIVKKELLISFGGFPADGKVCEDLYTWMRMYELGEFAYDDYMGARINQFRDLSRNKRVGSIPYPVIFYSRNPHKLNFKIEKYLWSIHVKHIFGSMLMAHRVEAFLRLQKANSIFGVKNYFLYLLIVLPSTLFKTIKFVKRKKSQ